MRPVVSVAVLGVLVVVLAQPVVYSLDNSPPAVWDFEDATLGQLPAGWSAAKTGDGPGSVWKILEDPSAPRGPKVLAQTSSQGPRSLFNLCVADHSSYADVDITVSLKASEGKIDQGGGPLWRCKDANNYYLARVNPLENNFRIYKVVAGKRYELGSADVEAPRGKWHTIRVVHKGGSIQCYFNDRLLLDVKDDAIQGAGKLGLWTKADAATSFDALQMRQPQ